MFFPRLRWADVYPESGLSGGGGVVIADTKIIVINGMRTITGLYREYEMEHDIWGNKCASVRASFKKKTSRKGKYEYTNWYREKSGGGLECVGKEEPNYTKYYPPEPKPPYSFEVLEYEQHLIIGLKDYEANLKLFKECLAFGLEDCKNLTHPLYKNPEKALSSVRAPGVNSARSQISGRTETIECHEKGCMRYVWHSGDSTGWGMVDGKWYCETHYPLHSPVLLSTKHKEKEDMCRGDGDCDECEHQDECPVIAEEES